VFNMLRCVRACWVGVTRNAVVTPCDSTRAEDITTMWCTLCGHVFCKGCLHAALKKRAACPLCNKHTTVQMTHPLFL